MVGELRRLQRAVSPFPFVSPADALSLDARSDTGPALVHGLALEGVDFAALTVCALTNQAEWGLFCGYLNVVAEDAEDGRVLVVLYLPTSLRDGNHTQLGALAVVTTNLPLVGDILPIDLA